MFLDAGESVGVNIPFDSYSFRTFDEKENSWRIYAGEYTIMVGSSSQNILLESKVEIEGEPVKNMGGDELRKGIIKAAKEAEPELKAEDTERTEITLHSPFIYLKRAKGMGGRLLYRIADKYCTSKKDPALLTLRYLYMRSIAQYAGFNGEQTKGLLLVCNGHLFKGLKKIIFKK